MTTLTINIDDDLKQQVEQFARDSGLSLEEAATELIQRTADIRKLRALRKRGRGYAEKAGVESEEDLYEAVREWRTENPGKAAGEKA